MFLEFQQRIPCKLSSSHSIKLLSVAKAATVVAVKRFSSAFDSSFFGKIKSFYFGCILSTHIIVGLFI